MPTTSPPTSDPQLHPAADPQLPSAADPTAAPPVRPTAGPPADPQLHPPGGRLEAWLRPMWIERGGGFVDPSGVSPASLDATEVVTTAGTHILTEATMARYLLVIEWLAGTRLLPRDIVALRVAVLDRFEADPAAMADRLATASELVTTIADLDPVTRARRRLGLRLTVTARAACRGEREPIVQCLQRLDPVVVITGQGFMITEEARIAWRLQRELVAHVAGLGLEGAGADGAPTPAEIERWSPARQRDLANAPVHFIAVRSTLRRLAPTERRAVATALAQTVRSPQSLELATAVLTEARPDTDVAGTIRRRLADLRSPGRS